MAFYETRFPEDISLGALSIPSFKTDVIVFDSGREQRNQRWSEVKNSYDVGYGIRTRQQLNALAAFFYEMRGRAHSFRYKDWLDYSAENETLAYSGSSTIQLTKVYGNGYNNYTKNIVKPVSGTVTLKVNGSNYSSFTVNTTNGVVTLTGSPLPLISDVITWSGEFDIPCRFDQDQLSINLKEAELGETSVMLSEVRI